MWSFHNIWFWRKDDVLTLWGFLVSKFKNTHILVQQTSGPPVTSLHSTAHLENIHFEGTVCGLLRTPLHICTYSHIQIPLVQGFTNCLLLYYYFMPYHKLYRLCTCKYFQYDMSSIYVQRKLETKVHLRWPTHYINNQQNHRAEIRYKRVLLNYTFQSQLSVFSLCRKSFLIHDTLQNMHRPKTVF